MSAMSTYRLSLRDPELNMRCQSWGCRLYRFHGGGACSVPGPAVAKETISFAARTCMAWSRTSTLT